MYVCVCVCVISVDKLLDTINCIYLKLEFQVLYKHKLASIDLIRFSHGYMKMLIFGENQEK